MEKELQDNLTAIKCVYDLTIDTELRGKLMELTMSLTNHYVKENDKSNIYIVYVSERIIKEPTITGNRLKISTIQEDFREWYKNNYDNKITPDLMRLFKEYLIVTFGKYPSNGWGHISLNEEEI